MPTRDHAVTRGRPRPVSHAFRFLLAAVMTMAAVLVPVSGASAAEVPAIDDVQMQGTPPSIVGDEFRLDATWSIADGAAVEGDSFRLDFPDDVEGFDTTFELRDSGGDVVGDCTGDLGGVTCVFSDYVETHQDVHGTLFFYAKASAEKSDGEFVFTDGFGVEYRVPLPGPIGPRGEGTKPDQENLDKSGNVYTPGGDIDWRLAFAARHLLTPDGDSITLTDNYDTRLTYREDLRVNIWQGGEPSEGGGFAAFPQDVRGGAAGTFWVESDPGTHSFRFGINGLDTLDPDSQFAVSYSTGVPDGTIDGMSFANSISGVGVTADVATVRYRAAGGTGDGDAVFGRIEVLKTDSVSGAPLPGASFDVRLGGVTVASLGPTDVSGSATTGDLAPGDYELVETVAPAGFELDATPVPVTITAAGGTIAVTVENTPTAVVPPSGRIEVLKTDSVSGAPLAGAHFDVRRGGATVATLGPTDASGSALTGDLAPGDYELVETVAPAGFELDATPVPVTITAAGGTVAVTVENTPTAVVPPTGEPTTPGGSDQPAVTPPLASTGGELGIVPAFAGVALLCAGVWLLLARRRKQGFEAVRPG